MPLALLLHSFIKPLETGLRRLEPWNVAVQLEELIATRAQSAYLVEWFGSFLPLSGLTLRIAISNLTALRERYQMVLVEAARLDAPSPSLTEPLAGLAGTVVGLMLSPTGGAILIELAIIVQDLGPWYVRPLMITAGVIAIGLFPTLAALGVLPWVGGVLLGAVPLMATFWSVNNPLIRNLLDFLPALARLFEAMGGFLRQIMGPRDGVRNPLVRLGLGILDAVAGLLPQFLALIAVLVEGVGPMLGVQARQIGPFFALVQSSVALMKQLLDDAIQGFESFFGQGGRLAQTVQSLLKIITDIDWEVVFRPLVYFLFVQDLMNYIRLAATKQAVEDYAEQMKTWFGKVVLIGARPFVDAIVIFALMMPTLMALKKPSSSSSGGSSSPLFPPAPPFPTFPDRPRTALLDALSYLVPPPGAARSVANGLPSGLLALQGMPYAMSQEGIAGIARREAVPSVFAGEYTRIVREGGGRSIAEQFAALRNQELLLRSALTAVVDSILPEAVRTQLPALAPLFARLDRELYGLRPTSPSSAPTTGANSLPVLQVDDRDTRLLPVVRRLRIQINNNANDTQDADEGVRRAARDRTNAWAERLRTALETMPPVTPAMPGSGG